LNEIIEARILVKQEAIARLDKIIESVQDMIDNEAILTTNNKRFLKNAINEISKLRYVLRISKN
jgi:hypothetical protein